MGSPFFRFKRFTVWHDRCAMKVGTDGVLLGAWCPLPDSASKRMRVLDIGTGSGLVALMIAQRLYDVNRQFSIVGIDIEQDAVEQSEYNYKQSPWQEHLECKACSLQTFTTDVPFDLIVSNPPYFQNSLKNPDYARNTARHTDTLSYVELLSHSSELLNNGGILALILPLEAEKEIMELATRYSLQLTNISYVHPKPGKDAKRILAAFSKNVSPQVEPISTHFYIESIDSPRSEEYREITKDFYL